MKFNNPAIAGTAYLVATSAAAAASSEVVDHPGYAPYSEPLSEGSYFDQFDGPNNDGWVPSEAATKDDSTARYTGKWAIEEATVNPGYKGDKGLVVKTPGALHAISKNLPVPFDNKDNTLVLQYEVKLQNGLGCGGAYIKLLSEEGKPSGESPFNDKTPYQVMFGPDKCGASNKVHFIVRRVNPNTGKYSEHALKTPPMAKIVKTSVLYTLVIKPTQEFEIRIDGEVVRAGSLLDDKYFDIQPAKEIVDTKSTKPDDWDEREHIRDPEAVKPDDWDESQLFVIPDPDAVKPDDWEEEEPVQIPDPSVAKPDDWDDEEDGEWEAPLIDNPDCKLHGCGPWTAPKIKNPKYRGKWYAPLIKNPLFKGPWKPKTVANPDYYEEKTPADLEPIGAVGFELWTMDDGILFDDLYLGHSIEEAEAIGNSTFIPKLAIERADASVNSPRAKYEPAKPKADTVQLRSKISEIVDTAVEKATGFAKRANEWYVSFSTDPKNTLVQRPGEAVLYSSVFLSGFSVIMGIWSVLVYLVSGGGSATSVPVELQEARDRAAAKATLKKAEAEAEAEAEAGAESESTSTTASEKHETKTSKRA